MNVAQISEQDRQTFLRGFQAYRANDDEHDGYNYAHRDVLEAKLQAGEGTLDVVEIDLLEITVANVVSIETNEAEYDRLVGLLYP